MLKNQKRGDRLAHLKRIKAKRSNYYNNYTKTAVQLGKLAHTACLCSCYMCCNPRRHGEITIQERRFNIISRYESLESIDKYNNRH